MMRYSPQCACGSNPTGNFGGIVRSYKGCQWLTNLLKTLRRHSLAYCPPTTNGILDRVETFSF